ncbi:MAG TPA: hypothetical protein VFU97_15790 [Xanthobacteraceae bacterium]|nr:hypothetical protein [Xanthobacteraceae bacterium]
MSETPGGTSSAALGSPATSRGRGARTAPGHQLAGDGGGRGALDVAQALGQLAGGGSNLDPLAGAGAAVELAGAVLAVLALDRG